MIGMEALLRSIAENTAVAAAIAAGIVWFLVALWKRFGQSGLAPGLQTRLVAALTAAIVTTAQQWLMGRVDIGVAIAVFLTAWVGSAGIYNMTKLPASIKQAADDRRQASED